MNLAVVSHDAGGAEVVSSYLRRNQADAICVLAGPARAIFHRKIPNAPVVPLDEALDGADLLLCGTSWQSDLEFDAVALARKRGVRSAAFLDHWVNYRERFVRSGETHFPDEIWVGDADAERLALQCFAPSLIRRVENPYFLDLRDDFAARPRRLSGGGLSVLYVTEPVREHGLRQSGNERMLGYVEEEALDYLLSNVHVLLSLYMNREPDADIERIVIRPHPSEAADKYHWAARRFPNLPIVAGGIRTLVDEIADADVVVGCESMALAVALLGDRVAVSCIPPGGRACVLPQADIVHLSNIVGARAPVEELKRS